MSDTERMPCGFMTYQAPGKHPGGESWDLLQTVAPGGEGKQGEGPGSGIRSGWPEERARRERDRALGGGSTPSAGVPQSLCVWSNAPGHVSLPPSAHPGAGIG